MRRRTPQRAALDRKADQVRDELRERVGRCEYCGRRNHGLQVHEILRGVGYRKDTQDKPLNQLVLCGDCHPLMAGRPWAEQLAILKRSRPEDFSLTRFHELAQRKTPDLSEVTMWLKRYAWVPSTEFFQ